MSQLGRLRIEKIEKIEDRRSNSALNTVLANFDVLIQEHEQI